MDISTKDKNKTLRRYGKGTIETIIESARCQVNQSHTIEFYNSLDQTLNYFYTSILSKYDKEEEKVIAESMADTLLEKGHLKRAHFLYDRINSSKADLTKRFMKVEGIKS